MNTPAAPFASTRPQDKRAERDLFGRVARGAGEPTSRHRAADYDAVCERLPLPAEAPRVLDLGCGDGPWTERLLARGHRVTSVDLSEESVRAGRARIGGGAWCIADAEGLPFADASFDACVLGGVVHHFPDPLPLLREVRRVLRPGATILACEPNAANPYVFLTNLLIGPRFLRRAFSPNECPVTRASLVRRARRAGFRRARAEAVRLLPRLPAAGIGPYFRRCVLGLSGRIGGGNYVVLTGAA